RRLFPYGIWLPLAWPACMRSVWSDRPDVLLTSGPPQWVHVLGYGLKRLFRIPWVADFRDPWITNNEIRGVSGPDRRWQADWEATVLKEADRVIANAPGARDGLRQAYPAQQHKIVSITNGYDPERFSGAGAPSRASEEGRKGRIVHVGEIYSGRDPRPFLD